MKTPRVKFTKDQIDYLLPLLEKGDWKNISEWARTQKGHYVEDNFVRCSICDRTDSLPGCIYHLANEHGVTFALALSKGISQIGFIS